MIDKLIASCKPVDETAERFAKKLSEDNLGIVTRAGLQALAMEQLRQALPLDGPFMRLLYDRLMNSPMGFMTDRGPHAWKADMKTPYAPDVVRDVAIQAALNGLAWVGCEWMIFSGKLYVTQPGWWRKLMDVRGLTDLEFDRSPPFRKPGCDSVLVRCTASWRMSGLPDRIRGTDGRDGTLIPVISYGKETPDALLGKALAKLFARIYRQATGSLRTMPDPDLADGAAQDRPSGAAVGVQSKAEALAAALAHPGSDTVGETPYLPEPDVVASEPGPSDDQRQQDPPGAE